MELNETIEKLNTIGKSEGVRVELDSNNQLVAFVGDKQAKSVMIRIIEDVQSDLSIRVIKDKQGGYDILYTNLPTAEDCLSRGGVCAEFVEKYFLSSYVRKLISLPAINKLADLLAPNNGGGFTANPITKPFKELCKALVISLKKAYPTKAGFINEMSVKGYISDPAMADMYLEKIRIKGKEVAASQFIIALIKWHITSDNENAVNTKCNVAFSLEQYQQFASDSLVKAATKEVSQSIDEDELDI